MYTKNRIYVFDNFIIKMKVYLKNVYSHIRPYKWIDQPKMG